MSELLTRKQRRALSALMGSRTIQDAAEAAGISERTLSRWLSLPAFRAALVDAQAAALEGTARRLATLSAAALDALADGLKSPEVGQRLRAAQLVLDALVKLRELDLERRISALEANYEKS